MLAALLTLAVAPPGGQYWVYLGTYTAPNASKGIYRCSFDAATGELGQPELAAELTSPSFVCFRPDGKVLYAVGETGGKDGGGVYAFAVDAKTGEVTKLDQATSGSAGPCHCVTDATGDTLLVANYGGGTCKFLDLKPDGRFSGESTATPFLGSGPNRTRQDKPHAHCGAFAGDFAYVVDLGSDRVWRFRKTTDRLSDGKPFRPASAFRLDVDNPVKMPAGSGPRHIALDPAGDLAFVCGELDSTVNVLKLTPTGGSVVQSVSTLPGGNPVKGNSTAEVVRHPSGKFVYVSNRGHNSVAAFGWDGQKLTPIGHATAGIKVPRNFNLSPDGTWMLVANQDGNDVAVFKIGADGLPTPTGKAVKVGKPVCVKFLPRG
jgi:6-phosphogluconolactonase